MNLQKTIRRILREETNINMRLRRRLSLIDEEVKYRMDVVYRPNNICRYESGEELLEVITEATIDSIYYKYFDDIDDTSDEWVKIFLFIEKYIKDKYGSDLKNYYHINCGN
jgi:ADP-ribose pyrophosphatase YjhB (NUDIX family)